MNKGQGTIARTNKVEPPAAATVTAANNGLTLSGTTVQLGGANPLIQLTTVTQGIFQYRHARTGGVIFDLDPANGIYQLGDAGNVLNNTFLIINDTLRFVELFSGVTNVLKFDAANKIFDVTFASNLYLNIDKSSDLYEFGDINGSNSGSTFVMNDATGITFITISSGQRLLLDTAAGNYRLGDLGGFGNSTNLALLDTVQQATMSSGGFTMLSLDLVNGIFQLGASAGGTANTSFFQIDDPNQSFTTVSGGNVNGLLIDLTAGNIVASIGDYAAVGTNTSLTVNDNTKLATIFARNGITINQLGGSGLLTFVNALTNHAAANVGTLLNAPAAGDPTKWIRINDAGTSRFIPCW